ARSRHQGRDRDRLRGQGRTLRPPCRGTSRVGSRAFAAGSGFPALPGAGRRLRRENEIASMTPRKWGDLVAFRLPAPVDGARLADTVVTRRSDDVLATFLAGRQVWRSPS